MAAAAVANNFATNQVFLVSEFKKGKGGLIEKVHRNDVGSIALGANHQLDVP
jgi:hypothetical protein